MKEAIVIGIVCIGGLFGMLIDITTKSCPACWMVGVVTGVIVMVISED